jgi:rare lipoprotein A (peptidoglycan hydrolase)
MRRILSIMTLLLIAALFASQTATAFAEPPKKEASNTKKAKAKTSKSKPKKEKKAPAKAVKLAAVDPDPLHRATWYRTEGTRVHKEHPTAAYNHAPRGSFLLVINEKNGKSCIVEVTDRMGSRKHKTIDLSHKAFGMLASHSYGCITVKVMPAPVSAPAPALDSQPDKKEENI